MNSIMDKKQSITQKTYSIISKLYIDDFEKDYSDFNLIDKAIRIIKNNNLLNSPVCDLGSGGGNVIDYLLINDIKKIKSVELNESFIIHLKNKYLNTPNVKIINADMEYFLKSQDKNSIAGYFASYSIIHILDENVDTLFKNIYETLMPHGVFVMSCHKGTYKGLEVDPYQVQADKRLKTNSKIEVYINYFSEIELKERLHKSGFKKIEIMTFSPELEKGDFPTQKIWVLAQK
jgi:SAM-dependent methyltransferase